MMQTLILRTIAPLLIGLMIVFSIFVLLRGHDEPGGGFIGGLIAASAFALYAIACGVQAVRRALYFHPMTIAGNGVFFATIAGVPSLWNEVTYLTGLWWTPVLPGGSELKLSTPLVFDIGVWLTVVGTVTGIALALSERWED